MDLRLWKKKNKPYAKCTGCGRAVKRKQLKFSVYSRKLLCPVCRRRRR